MQILIHEPTSLWTAELERAWGPHPRQTVRWRPYSDDLLSEASKSELVLLVVSPENESLDLIRQLKTANSAVHLICLISAEDQGWESLARELGVVAVLPDTTSKKCVVELVDQVALP